MNIAEASIKKKTVTLLFAFVLLGGGMAAYENIGRLEDPNFVIKDAKIYTLYPGATPREVEEEVTEVIESAAQQLGQLRELESLSKPGLSILTVTMQDKYGPDKLPQVWDELRRKVGDAQGDLPPGAGPSIVFDDFGDVFGVLYSITGDGYTYKEIYDFAKDLRKELLLVDGVGKVAFSGNQQEVIYVEISRQRMAALGIPESAIYQTLDEQNIVAPSGDAVAGTERIAIRPTGEVSSVEVINDLLVIDEKTGSYLRLGDIANVYRGYKDPPQNLYRYNSKPAVILGVSMVGGANVVKVGKAVKAKIADYESRIPVGMVLNEVSFQGDQVEQSVNGFVVSLAQAVGIVIVVLLIFMGVRSGLLIAITLLLTVAGTLMVMQIWGIQLQRISLGALIIALGMLVDNAIVVVDGVLVGVHKKVSKIKAAATIVAQTQWPLLGATIIAVLAFAGIGLSQDNSGEYCRSLYQVVLISLMLSWLTAITITPLLCDMMLKGASKNEGAGPDGAEQTAGEEEPDPYGGAFYTKFRGFLTVCLKWRWLTLGVMVGMLVLSIVGFSFIKLAFFPSLDRPQFALDVFLPEGTDIYETSRVLFEIEEHLLAQDAVTEVATSVGAGNQRFMLTYTPEDPNKSYGQLIVGVRDQTLINDLISATEVEMNARYPEMILNGWRFMIGPAGGAKIGARFIGDDPEELRRLAEEAMAIMRADPQSKTVRSDWRQKVKVVRPVFSEAKARSAGVDRTAFKNTLQRVFSGKQTGIYREGEDLIPIIARSPEAERDSTYEATNAQIWSPIAGKMIPVQQVISGIETVFDDNIIARRDRKRTIEAMCDLKWGLTSELFDRIRPKIEAIPLPDGYEIAWGAEFEKQTRANAGVSKNLPLSFLVMILIIIVLFNSVKRASVITLTIPFLIVGVALGLLITNTPFSFMALLGVLSLVGMVIKNAIVLVDQIVLELSEGKPRFQAVVDATISRARPVAMAALTTVMGMAPLIPDVFFGDMAITIMFGLTFATGLTLVIIPVMYAAFYNIRPDEVLKTEVAK